jgi:hypothetical protein
LRPGFAVRTVLPLAGLAAVALRRAAGARPFLAAAAAAGRADFAAPVAGRRPAAFAGLVRPRGALRLADWDVVTPVTFLRAAAAPLPILRLTTFA